MIDEKTTQEIIDAYMGWDRFEKPNGIDIIDFCLIPKTNGEEFKSREQVTERLEDLHNRVEPTNFEEEFIKAKLYASITYLNALMGEVLPFSEYVKRVTGVTPQLIPESVIQKHKEIMYDHLKKMGYNPDRESARKFIEKLTVKKEEAMRQAKYCQEHLIPILLKSLGFKDLKIPYELKLVEVDDYWRGWTSTEPDGSFLMRFNFFKDREWYQGDMEVLPLHEYGHFIQAANLTRGIKSGKINPFVGVTTVQDPHTFGGEGTANAILDLPEVEEALSPHGLLNRDRSVVGYYLRNNAHIRINEGGNKDELLKYILDNNPFYPKDYIVKSLDRWKDNPSRRAYEYIYGISRFKHRQLLERLPLEKKKEYLRCAMSTYMTPNRLMEFANQLFSG